MQELFSYAARVKSFSPNARLYLIASFTGALYHSVFSVLGNLYIMQAGLTEGFLGTMISVNSFSAVLFALPAGILSDRIGRRKALFCAAGLTACAQGVLILFPISHVILAATLVGGAAGAVMMVSGSPFLAENSTKEERSHLFSVSMAAFTISGIGGSFLGGSLPVLWGKILQVSVTSAGVYRATLLSALFLLALSIIPYSMIKDPPRGNVVRVGWGLKLKRPRLAMQLMAPELLMGLGAGMFVPFLNVFFANHLKATTLQLGLIFSTMSLITTIAVLMAPLLGNRYGKVGAAVRTRLLSVPILVLMALSGNLWVVAGGAWVRSALMNMSNPLVQSFNMEIIDPGERATVSSMLNMLWSLGWGLSAKFGGYLMENYSYTTPYFFTVVLYTISALLFHHFFASRETELSAMVAD